MSFEITAQYEELDQVATRFDNQSEAIRDTYVRVLRAVEALEEGGWIGEGANSFFQEMRSEVGPSTIRLFNALERAGQVTRQISSRLRQAEEEAAGYFKR
jgi:WXG100 family type VII secretion target